MPNLRSSSQKILRSGKKISAIPLKKHKRKRESSKQKAAKNQKIENVTSSTGSSDFDFKIPVEIILSENVYEKRNVDNLDNFSDSSSDDSYEPPVDIGIYTERLEEFENFGKIQNDDVSSDESYEPPVDIGEYAKKLEEDFFENPTHTVSYPTAKNAHISICTK